MTDLWWVPYELVGLGVLIVLLSLPLVWKKVPRNAYYGFRSRLTLSSDRIWFAANAYAGKQFILASLWLIAGGVGAFFVESLSGWTALGLQLPGLLALAYASARCFLWRMAK